MDIRDIILKLHGNWPKLKFDIFLKIHVPGRVYGNWAKLKFDIFLKIHVHLIFVIFHDRGVMKIDEKQSA